MTTITRRAAILLGGTAIAATATAFALRRFAGDDISPGERDAMARVAASFMERFGVPGLSVAIAHHGRMVYQQPFGVANRDSNEPVSPSTLFRIASVSKPITSATIFTLIQQGKIRLEDKVFGKDGILGEKYATPPYKSYVQDVTIDHLLTHTCGGWDNGPGDPMFQYPAMDQDALISWTIDNQPLPNPPGTHWAYSNFGYCLLGRVIEKVTGRIYSEYVKSEILAPCGISDMRISGNTMDQRAPDEAIYYGQNGENPYGMNLQRMDSHGGWLATPTDMVLFANHVDGFETAANILKRETITRMTTPCEANAHYARGWAVNSVGNWWHGGSLPGTSTIMVRTSSGFCWAAFTNTRRQPSNVIDLALDEMVWGMVRQVRDWRNA
jgi:CubicO group peptidase (beta-lactamase class C family)